MTRSMTGFGKASREVNGDLVSVELATVNHRYLDFNVRMPSGWASLDSDIRNMVKRHLFRGKVNVTVTRKRGGGGTHSIQLDTDLVKQYLEASKELTALLESDEKIPLGVLAQLDGVFSAKDDEEDLERAKEVVLAALNEALTKLTEMREREGRALASDISHRIRQIRERLAAIEVCLPDVNKLYESRLRARIDELKGDAGVTEERLALEIALMAEKGDVTEEIVRLKAHLDHFDEFLESSKPIGRELNFLVQEAQREINTLGVKVRDTDVARDIIATKAELEKVREQVQNVE